jgi:hypothetical protein
MRRLPRHSACSGGKKQEAQIQTKPLTADELNQQLLEAGLLSHLPARPDPASYQEVTHWTTCSKSMLPGSDENRGTATNRFEATPPEPPVVGYGVNYHGRSLPLAKMRFPKRGPGGDSD